MSKLAALTAKFKVSWAIRVRGLTKLGLWKHGFITLDHRIVNNELNGTIVGANFGQSFSAGNYSIILHS